MNVEQLRHSFTKADPRFGPVPFWWWSAEEITPERVRWQLKKFREGGLRNIGIINIAPTGPQYGSVSDQPAYFSEAWWEMFEVALREAERLGMRLWFYDQIGFSGANFPARIVSEHPEYSGYVLRRFRQEEVIPEGADFLGHIGDYTYVAMRQGFNWLDARATHLLLDKIHGEFERRFPYDLGKTIAGSFQDELPPLPLWTKEMPELYQERYQDDLLAKLPCLFEELEGFSEVRRRVYKIAAELAEKAFFIPISEWHEKHHMLIGCDQAGPARKVDPHGAQRLYLNYFRTHRWYSSPGADMDGEIKPHSSMVHLHGGKRVWLEAFHSSGWGGTLEETMHWLIPWFQAGATLYSPHAVYYSTRGGWWEWAPPDTGWRQPYFEHYSVFADTVSRVCALLSEGDHVADIAIHYPSYAASGWMSLSDGTSAEHPMLIANRLPNDELKHIEKVYKSLTGRWNRRELTATGALRQTQRDFDIVDDSALVKAAVAGKRLHIAGEQFAVLLLCGTTIMEEEALDKVQAWIQQGGLVIAIEVPEAQQTLAGVHYVNSAEAAVEVIEGQLPKRIEGGGMALQRHVEDADIFLLLPEHGELLNMHQPAVPGKTLQKSTVYRLRTSGAPELWDPVTGKKLSLDYTRDGDWIEVEVPFHSWPAALIVCAWDTKKQSRVQEDLVSQFLNSGKVQLLPDDQWRVLAISTLDNRYGDFDLHGRNAFMPIERRMVKVKQETFASQGLKEAWFQLETEDASWKERLWSEAAYWMACHGKHFEESAAWPVIYSHTLGDQAFKTWAGRMGRVPRRFLNLGEVEKGASVCVRTHVIAPKEGRYWMRVESNAKVTGTVNQQAIQWQGGPEEQTAWIELEQGENELILVAEAIITGLIRAGVEVNRIERAPLPKWLHVKHPHAQSAITTSLYYDGEQPIKNVRMVFAARGRVALYVNGNKVTEHGDFNPYIRQGQEEVDVTGLWHKGDNVIRFELPEGEGEVFADGVIEYADGETSIFCTTEAWKDEQGGASKVLHEAVLQFAETESLWMTSRPHPLPDVGWLMPHSVPDPKPLPFIYQPNQLGQAVWLRLPMPVGTKKIKIGCKGDLRMWIDGNEVAVQHGEATFPAQKAGALATVRVEPKGPYAEADVLNAPIRFETTYSRGELGDWRTQLCLPHHSGAVEYVTTFELSEAAQVAIDLGHVRGTAELWVDDEALGIRVWRPYIFTATQVLKEGRHQLRIRVTNTLGTHYEVGRPSHVVGGEPLYWNESNTSGTPQQFASGGLFGPVKLMKMTP
ncbi:hypothetical protein GCM10011391_34620 [Pullulanibacillus camelliae]|uniref:Alpha-L-rhamnosidase n=1 Tax=Pullulanibacillus camelliae TaxID=1707096 RepID=A0A8J2YMC9_9BACL|nr:hypothetical protein [Pullulanibacillus camelliae]GGE52837.1 hypothetical protein GCM10011391_34620 [Pullulanibacillus camelliae]